MNNNFNHIFKDYRIYLFIFFLILGITAYAVYDFYHFNNLREKNALIKGENKRDQVKLILNEVLDSIEIATARLSDTLSQRQYSNDEIEVLIKKAALENEFCIGIAVAFKPEKINKDAKDLNAPYYIKKNDQFGNLSTTYDYTNDSLEVAKWYTKVIEQKKGRWSNPYVGGVAQELIVDYGVPFYKKDTLGFQKISGVVSFSIDASYFSSFLHRITLGKAGFGIIINKDKYVISHPSTEVLTDQSSLRAQISEQTLLDEIVKNNEGYLTSFSEIAQEFTEFFYTTLNQGWILITAIPKTDLLEETNKINKKLINIALLLSLSVLCLIILSLKIWQGKTQNLWYFSILLGLILTCNIAFIWYLNQDENSDIESSSDTKILSQTTIDNYVTDQNIKLKQIDPDLKFTEIPTGLFIYDIDFKDAYDVSIIGKIWQKVPDDFEMKTEMNFVFPQASATGISVRIRPISKKHIDNYWLYNYDFNATYQFDFNYIKYPLIIKKINLQIAYPRPEDNVILTPDIESYAFINPSLNPGVSNDIFMPNAKVLSSYYSFHKHNFYSDLGNKNYMGLKRTPVLSFNIMIKNIIITSIITNLIPILIVAILVFLLPFTVDRIDGKTKEGSALNIIQASSGFFFVLLVSHIQLRNSIETQGLIYLEIFYFVMYFMLAIMSTAVLVYLKTDNFRMLEYKHNLIFKLSYWPILLLSIYIVSLVIFY
ncbi:MAG: cache domain-containing protein [Flavobacteriaceae bacterium]|nr:cache domain-containing protein [Flavobacteriaceae bacterium]